MLELQRSRVQTDENEPVGRAGFQPGTHSGLTTHLFSLSTSLDLRGSLELWPTCHMDCGNLRCPECTLCSPVERGWVWLASVLFLALPAYFPSARGEWLHAGSSTQLFARLIPYLAQVVDTPPNSPLHDVFPAWMRMR